jgi:streptogramin lyase
MKIRVRISWLLVLLCLLLSGRPVQAHASGLKVQYFPLPAQVTPLYPVFRGKQLWFSPFELGTLMYFTPPNGKITTVPLPHVFADDLAFLTTAASDGGFWVYGVGGDTPTAYLYYLTAQNKGVVYTSHAAAFSSTPGKDGSLWYTYDGNMISKMSPNGVETDFQIRAPGYSNQYAQIVRAADDSFWCSFSNITHITPQGKWRTFYLPPYSGTPRQLIPLPDDRIWILSVDVLGNSHIAIMNAKGEAQSYTFDVPVTTMDPSNDRASFGYTKNFTTALAPDGTLWFLDYRHTQLVHSTIYGHVIKLYSFPAGGLNTTLPATLTLGPDGALWVAEPDTHRIARITLP